MSNNQNDDERKRTLDRAVKIAQQLAYEWLNRDPIVEIRNKSAELYELIKDKPEYEDLKTVILASILGDKTND